MEEHIRKVTMFQEYLADKLKATNPEWIDIERQYTSKMMGKSSYCFLFRYVFNSKNDIDIILSANKETIISQTEIDFNNIDVYLIISANNGTRILDPTGKIPENDANHEYIICSRPENLFDHVVNLIVETSKYIIKTECFYSIAEAVDAKTYQNYVCPICIHTDNKKLCSLNMCKHIFCEDCIRKWIIRKDTCPLCRMNIADWD